MPLVLTIAVDERGGVSKSDDETRTAKHVPPVPELDIGGVEYDLVFVTYWVMNGTHFVGQGKYQGRWFKYNDLDEGRAKWNETSKFDYGWHKNRRFAYTYVCKNFVDRHDQCESANFPMPEKLHTMNHFMMRRSTKRVMNRVARSQSRHVNKKAKRESATPSRSSNKTSRGRFHKTPRTRRRGRAATKKLLG
jgi:hypothetical protein